MKFAIDGAHSTGKTTVFNAYRKKYPRFHYAMEAARDCPYSLNEGTRFASQDFIFRTQVTREMEAPLNEVVISDRSCYSQLAYIEYAQEEGNISYDEVELLKNHILRWGKTYTRVYVTPIEFPLVQDDVRSGDEEYRTEIDKKFRRILSQNYPSDRTMLLSGSVQERLSKLETQIFETIRKG